MTNQRSTMKPGQPGRVLFIGSSYYNNWYLSRALRQLGWKADTFVFGQEGAENFLHGWDYYFKDFGEGPYPYQWAWREEIDALTEQYRQWARSGARPHPRRPWGHSSLSWRERWKGWLKGLGRRVLGRKAETFEELLRTILSERHRRPLAEALERFLAFIHPQSTPALAPLRELARRYDIVHFTGINSMRWWSYLNPGLFAGMPIGWDLEVLKRLGKKIVYTNIGCQDGVSQSAFRRWGPYPVCDICRWRDQPGVCGDERNLNWGALRNSLADYQILLGGNRVDYNADARVHEVPEFYCLDPEFWKPDLEIPAEHRLNLPADAVKIYHAVGNHGLRTDGDQVNVKTTHLIVPAIQRLKAEGYKVELIFCTNVPNKDVRFHQAQADIVVDMLTFGFFGANVREAMMLGKPAVCFLRPEWLESMKAEIPGYPRDLPVVSATPETIHQVLIDLITNPEKRRELGRRGREFALTWHSAAAAGQRFAEIYGELMRRRRASVAA